MYQNDYKLILPIQIAIHDVFEGVIIFGQMLVKLNPTYLVIQLQVNRLINYSTMIHCHYYTLLIPTKLPQFPPR